MPADPPLSRKPAAWAGLLQDFSASLVVFLVALPLCLGIAIASGMPPAAGIMTGIIGGLVVGGLAGCPLQVSGPAAGLTVLVFQIVRDPKLGPGMLGVIILGAGLIQVSAALLRVGQWFRAVSPAVIEGMLAGIGVLIVASQFHVMIDGDPHSGGLANLAALPESLEAVFFSDSGTASEAFRVGVVTIGVMVLWKWAAPKRLRLLPAQLVALAAGVGVYLFCRTYGGWPELRTIPMPDTLADAVVFPTVEALRRATEPAVLLSMFSIAFIASAETLLSAAAVDGMHNGSRTHYDRELFAQGVGNALCGLVGALPMTGVIVRSAANVEAGGRTRLSSVFHGGWMLLVAVAFPFVLAALPRAALAAILVYTGFKLVDFKALRHLWQASRGEALIFLATLTTIVARDLLAGVVVGMALAVVKLLARFSHLAVRVEEEEGRTVLHLEGAATFIRLPYLANVLERVPAGSELHVRMEQLSYVDHACLTLLMEWEKRHAAQGGRLVLDWDTLTARFRKGARAAGFPGHVSPAPQTAAAGKARARKKKRRSAAAR